MGILILLLVLMSQGLAGKHSEPTRTKGPYMLSEVTVSWAKQALQGFNLKIWISNQMTLGLQAWGCGSGDCIPVPPHFGAEYPIGSGIEHLYGAGPWIGAKIDGISKVTEGYNGWDARKEILPQRGDTLRDRIWKTSLDSLSHPNKKGIDDDGDGFIDEDELDGTDNDGDWNPLTDDVGVDGIPDSFEVGCTGGYDPVTNPDPAYDNYDPSAHDSCRVNPDSTHPLKNNRNRYTEKNGIPDHGEPYVDEDYAVWSDNDLYCVATDTFNYPVIAGHIPMGVRVYQKSYAWEPSISTEAFIIQAYDIRNVGRRDWQEVSVGFFADMDVGPINVSGFSDRNYAAYDPTTRTAYTHNPVDGGSTPLGITFLGASMPLDSVRFVFRWYDFTTHLGPGTIDSIIYKWMSCDSGSSCIDSNQSPTSVSDPKVYLGISGLTLHPGDAVKLYYAIVSGYSISEMLDNAHIAQTLYDSEFTVGVEDHPEIIPHTFKLDQNYPNPFNPTTSIRFDIPKMSFVTLKLYNVLGQEIVTLVDEKKEAGKYEVIFDGSKLVSGVYFYRLQAGLFSETKKFVILK